MAAKKSKMSKDSDAGQPSTAHSQPHGSALNENTGYGPSRLLILAALAFSCVVTLLGLLNMPIWFSILLLGAMGLFVVLRYYQVLSRRKQRVNQAWAAAREGGAPDTSRLPGVYITYILGSGGHTGELCEMIKQTCKPSKNLHRRYIISSGDTHSINAVSEVETVIRTACPDTSSGTWDVVHVERARRVHQPLWTAPYTSIISALSVIDAIIQPPARYHQDAAGAAFRFPNLIITNGPGTGFIVCFVAHIMKLFYLLPTDRPRIVYIETWAHLTSLSLTGKLFYYTDIADLFIVQHKSLADRTGKRFIGEVAKYGNLLGIKG